MTNPDADSETARIICVNRFYWPDASATSQILTDLAISLAETGRAVDVVCSRVAGFDGGQAEGVTIHPVRTTRLARFGLPGKALDFASFYLPAAWRVWRLARAGDTILVKTDPPLMSVPLAMVAGWRGARLVCWIQDVYPEVATRLGVRLPGGLLRRLRNWSLRRAAHIVAIGDRMAGFLRSEGLAGERISVIHNWAHHEARPVSPAARADMRSSLGLNVDEFVVGYSGNLGRAHDLETVTSAARILQEQGEGNIRFLVIGGGHGLEPLLKSVQGLGLTNFLFRPQQPVERLAESLAAPDLHWLSLKPELEGLIVPSKFYGAAASARPILFVGDEEGEIARLIAQSGCGVSVRAGDGPAMADAILALRDDRDRQAQAGAAGANAITSQFSKAASLSLWQDLLSRA